MKKLLIFFCMAAVGLSALSCYDDTLIRETLDEHKELIEGLGADVEALKTLVEAVENADYITSVEIIEEDGKQVGYTITFYRHGKITVYYGNNGADSGDVENSGDSIFEEVYEKDGYMYFVLTDGTVYKVPMTASAQSSAIDIEFDVEPEMLVAPDTEYDIPYTIIGADDKTNVRVITNERYVRAYVKSENVSQGYISITIAPYDGTVSEEYYQSQLSVMVTVVDGKNNSVVKAINLKKGVLSLYESSYAVSKDGGQIIVPVRTNLEYEVVVPSEATWITYSPRTKSEIRTDELVFDIQPNEDLYYRQAEVCLVDSNGVQLESFFICQHGSGVIIDGDFSDWDQLDPAAVLVTECPPGAARGGLKVMKVNYDGQYLNFYFELDWNYLWEREYRGGNPLCIMLSSDPNTGGCEIWTDICCDYMIEGPYILNKDDYQSESAAQSMYHWTGPVHEAGWDWEGPVAEIPYSFVRVNDKCELSLEMDSLRSTGSFDENLAVGVEIYQWWDAAGILPSSGDRLTSTMLTVYGEQSEPVYPEEPQPEEHVVGLIGGFNNWSDDLIMQDNGEGWYVAEAYFDKPDTFCIRLDREWNVIYRLSDEYADGTMKPGVVYNIAQGNGPDPFISSSGAVTIYISKDLTQIKYIGCQWSKSLSEMGVKPGRVGVGAFGDYVLFSSAGELFLTSASTGEFIQKVPLPEGFEAGGVLVDDAGNVLVSGPDVRFDSGQLQLYKLDFMTLELTLLVDYNSANFYCSEMGNFRVKGDVNGDALITAHVAIGDTYYLVWKIDGGVISEWPEYGVLQGGSSWLAATGVVAPAGPYLSDGLFSLVYGDTNNLLYYDGSNWMEVYVTGFNANKNVNCISTAGLYDRKYLALTGCCHFYWEYTDLVILDVTDPKAPQKIFTTQINTHVTNEKGLMYSDVFIREENGELAAYVIDPWMDTLDKYLIPVE